VQRNQSAKLGKTKYLFTKKNTINKIKAQFLDILSRYQNNSTRKSESTKRQNIHRRPKDLALFEQDR
jgi:hypothetical protein